MASVHVWHAIAFVCRCGERCCWKKTVFSHVDATVMFRLNLVVCGRSELMVCYVVGGIVSIIRL